MIILASVTSVFLTLYEKIIINKKSKSVGVTILVPTLRVGTSGSLIARLCLVMTWGRGASGLHSHAERGNESSTK
jgi:hypothetical protein